MLTELQAESAKPKIRNVLKALNSCVGDFAQTQQHDDLDVVPDMMEAIEYYLGHQNESRAELEHKLKNAGSLNFTGDAPVFKTDHATNMILAIADRSGSRSKLENVFRAISNEIKNEVANRDNPEVDMFSGPYQPKSKEQVVGQALNKLDKEETKKSFYPSAFIHILRKSHGGTNGRDDRRTEVRTQGRDAEEGTGCSRRDGQEGRRESEIRKSQEESGQQGETGAGRQGSDRRSSTATYELARKAGVKAFMLRKSQPSLFGTHKELHSRSATTRTNKKTGKISTVSATMARVHVADHDYSPRGDVGANIDRWSMSHHGIFAEPNAESEWGISKGEMDSLVESVAADIPHYVFTTKTRMQRSDIRFSLNGKDAAGNTLVIKRDILRTSMTAYHSSMHADKTQGGLSKPLNRACMNIYKRLGVKKVNIYANCDVGGYAWAKFGFIPKSGHTHRNLMLDVGNRLDRCAVGTTIQKTTDREWEFRQFTPEEVAEVREWLKSHDHRTVWKISDYKGWDGAELGKALLLNQSWDGMLDIDNPDHMARFSAYVNPKQTKQKAQQLSLF